MKSTYQLIGVYLDGKPIPITKPDIVNNSDPDSTIKISHLLQYISQDDLMNEISLYLHYTTLSFEIEDEYLFNPVVAKLSIKRALQLCELVTNIKNTSFINFVYYGDLKKVIHLFKVLYNL